VSKRNEALDLRVYNLAAWDAHKYHTRPNLEKLSAAMDKRAQESPTDEPKPKDYQLKPAAPTAAPPNPEPEKPAPVKPKPFVKRKPGGFVGGWR
jgi:phage terminase large subunit GpA-like protein